MSRLSNPRNLQRSNLGALTDERARRSMSEIGSSGCGCPLYRQSRTLYRRLRMSVKGIEGRVMVSSAEDKLILTPSAAPAPGR